MIDNSPELSCEYSNGVLTVVGQLGEKRIGMSMPCVDDDYEKAYLEAKLRAYLGNALLYWHVENNEHSLRSKDA